jgi:hypothetical protein
VGRVEGDLLNLGEVVLDVLVQEELSDLAERELTLRPDVGEIEDVDLLVLPEVLGLLGGHGLDLDVPSREVTLLNGVVQILLMSIGRVVVGVLLGDEACTLLRLEVDLGIHPLALLVDELGSVSVVAVHLAPVLGDTAVAHEDHDLVDGFGVLAQVVPEHCRVVGMGQMGSRITLLRMDEKREFGRFLPFS